MNRILPVTMAAALAAVGQAHAQSLDYGELQRLFGEPVTTSATGFPQRQSDVPATMEIVTADDIRRSGARDLPGVLRHVAGVDVLQWSNDDADISVRGYDQAFSHRLLVLIDGRQVYADYYGFTPWNVLPVELANIRQIEIVKGPNSALFGFNAVGGVINIITYNPLYDDVNTASLTGGSQSLVEGSAVATVKLGDIGAFNVSAGGRSNRDFSTPIPPAEGESRVPDNRGAVDAKGVFHLGDKVELRIEASHAQADSNNVTPIYTFQSAQVYADSVMARVTADTDFGLVQATAYTNRIRELLPADPPIGALDFNNRVVVAQVQDVVKLGDDHILRGTVEFRHNAVNTTPVGGGTVFYDVITVGGLWSWTIDPSLTLTNAVRADTLLLGRSGSLPPGYPFANTAWNRSLLEPSANTGLVWKADDLDTLRLTASRGVQVPSLANFGAFLTISPVLKQIGVPTVDPTIVTNYEFGWDRRVPDLGGQFRASVFHQRSDDILAVRGGLIPTASGPFFTQANVASSIANGVELGLSGSLPENWRWGLDYRAEFVTDHFFGGLTNTSTLTDFQHTTPAHLVDAHLGWSSGNWEIDGYVRYQSRTYGFLPTPTGAGVLTAIKDYVSADGRVGYRLTDNVTLAVSGQNLSLATQQQTSGPKVERRIYATVSVAF